MEKVEFKILLGANGFFELSKSFTASLFFVIFFSLSSIAHLQSQFQCKPLLLEHHPDFHQMMSVRELRDSQQSIALIWPEGAYNIERLNPGKTNVTSIGTPEPFLSEQIMILSNRKETILVPIDAIKVGASFKKNKTVFTVTKITNENYLKVEYRYNDETYGAGLRSDRPTFQVNPVVALVVDRSIGEHLKIVIRLVGKEHIIFVNLPVNIRENERAEAMQLLVKRIEMLPPKVIPLIEAVQIKPDEFQALNRLAVGCANEKGGMAIRLHSIDSTTWFHEVGHMVNFFLLKHEHQFYYKSEKSRVPKKWILAHSKDNRFISDIAASKPDLEEDFAETFAAYLETDGGRLAPELRRWFPNKFKFLDELFFEKSLL